MSILMSVSKSTQVLSKIYFRGTPEQDQKALRTIGSEWPDYRDKAGLAVWPGVGKNFSHGQPPQDDSVGSWVVWVPGLFSPWKQRSVKFQSTYRRFVWNKGSWKCHPQKLSPFRFDLDDVSYRTHWALPSCSFKGKHRKTWLTPYLPRRFI